MRDWIRLSVILAGAGAAVAAVVGLGCQRTVSALEPGPGPERSQAATPIAAGAEAGDDWVVQRVGGDLSARTTGHDGAYRFGDAMLIDTPLPVGYPPPTPPGAIELKKYPPVRRAERSGEMAPDIGMNLAFFPLFNHIKRREIAMTSPVEMNYHGRTLGAGDGGGGAELRAPDRWTMSFLYRQPENGQTGSDRGVEIVDVPAVTVVSIGVRGRYSWEKTKAALYELSDWLVDHPEWEAAGDARSLYYNGPERRNRDAWAEVQLPVRPRVSG